MRKRAEGPVEPKFPSVQRRCKYCKLMFKTKATYNGSQMKFCCEQHRKAFDKEGEVPFDSILRKQERRMREICREEIGLALIGLSDPAHLEASTAR